MCVKRKTQSLRTKRLYVDTIREILYISGAIAIAIISQLYQSELIDDDGPINDLQSAHYDLCSSLFYQFRRDSSSDEAFWCSLEGRHDGAGCGSGCLSEPITRKMDARSASYTA